MLLSSWLKSFTSWTCTNDRNLAVSHCSVCIELIVCECIVRVPVRLLNTFMLMGVLAFK